MSGPNAAPPVAGAPAWTCGAKGRDDRAYQSATNLPAGLTLPAARDLAEYKIRVNTIAPGSFETPLLMGLPEEYRKRIGELVPHPARLGHASEFAGLAAHIVENEMLNGETIRLDGAYR